MATLNMKVLEYQTAKGRKPYVEWVRGLEDREGVARIRMRINRIRLGQLGHRRNVGDKVWELKIPCGPGYRVYYVQDRNQHVVLLCGGDKASQSKDIPRAKSLAADYWRRTS